MGNLMDVVKQQQLNSKTTNYTNYVSKKELLASNVLTKVQAQTITQLKNCFSFSLHVSKQYLVITMYYNSTKKYAYWAVKLDTMDYVEMGSIKECKEYVNGQLNK